MFKKYLDMLFIHPPAVVEERKSFVDSDVAYSDQFVAMPVGFFSMADHLDRAGYQTGIINLGERMLQRGQTETFRDLIVKIFSEYDPGIVGMDLHWWVHSAGVVETARLIKEIQPEIKIVLGGITSSFFADEILEKYQCIDYVMVGECDQAIVRMVSELMKDHPNKSLISNLTYRDGKVIVNNPVQLPSIEEKLEITRYDLLIDSPMVNKDRALIPITRGCTQNCRYCGSSKESFGRNMKREKMCMITPSTLVRLIKQNSDKGRDKVYVYGDIRDGGKAYVKEFFIRLNQAEIHNTHIVFEFFYPPTDDYVKEWVIWAEKNGNTLEATFSPDSGNEKLRKETGRHYSNQKILDSCKLINGYKIPLSVYFLYGLPGQTKETVEETLELSDQIVAIYADKFKRTDLRHEVIGYEFMQVPDVGSIVYQNPGKYGVQLLFNGFDDLVNVMKSSKHWSQLVGFTTDHFNKKELIDEYYYIRRRVWEIYHKYGLLTDEEFGKKVSDLLEDQKVFEKIYA